MKHLLACTVITIGIVFAISAQGYSPAITRVDTSPVSQNTTPLAPDTSSSAQVPAPVAQTPPSPVSDLPTRLAIPSIDLNDPIVQLGVNAKGEMDVPDGNTSNVGWYKDGTIPGNIGSAVMDAHVFAAFKNLSSVKAGNDIYVVTQSGKSLHFLVTDASYYVLDQMPLQYIFNRNDASHLVLITCAGTFQKSMGTYNHRLVVYATEVI